MTVYKVGNKRMRLLHVISANQSSIMIDIDTEKYPIVVEVPIDKLEEIELENSIYPSEEHLTVKERNRFGIAKSIILEVSNELKGMKMLDRKLRKQIISNSAEKYNISTSKVRKLVIKYWKSGMIMNSVAIKYPRNQGKRSRQGKNGFRVTEMDERNFLSSIKKHYLTRELKPLQHAYDYCIKDYYTVINEEGYHKLLDAIPTYNQFYYIFKKNYEGTKELIRARYGDVVAKETVRPVTESVGSANVFPTYELDSTILDSYALSYMDDDIDVEIVGRPVIYLIVENISSRIAFFYLSYEKFMSEVASINSLIYGLTCSDKYMSLMNIDTDEYVGFLPSALVIDRGELTSTGIIEAISGVGVSVSVTAGMRASYKPKVERLIGKINSELAKFVPGTIKKDRQHNPRTEKDYRLRASLTLQDLAMICHKIIVQHNNHDVVESFLDPDYVNRKYTPNDIYDFLTKKYAIINRTIDEKNAIMMLLTTSDATVTESGVRFKNLEYISKKILKEGWIEKARIKGRYRIKIKYNQIDVRTIYYFDDSSGTLHELKLTEKFKLFSDLSFPEVELFFKNRQQRIDNQNRNALEERINNFDVISKIVNESITKKKNSNNKKSNNAKVKAIGENRDMAIALERKMHRDVLFNDEQVADDDVADSEDENEILDMIIETIGEIE